MNDATASLYAREMSLVFCAVSFFALRRVGWWRGTLLSLLVSGLLGFGAIWLLGSNLGQWKFSAAVYRSLWLAHGCAQACFGVLYLETLRKKGPSGATTTPGKQVEPACATPN